MFRRIITFVCNDRGYKFKGMDIEWRATAFSQPQRCPKPQPRSQPETHHRLRQR